MTRGRSPAARARELESRRKEALALSAWSAGMTFDQIAREVGYANRGGAHKAIARALKAVVEPDRKKLVGLMEVQLRENQRRMIAIATDKSASPQVQIAAAREYRESQESHRRLLGLDAPVRAEIAGPEGGAIPVEVTAAELRDRLRDLRERKAAQEGQVIEIHPREEPA